MRTRLASSICAVVLASLLSNHVDAGLLTTDPNAIPGWQGTTPFASIVGGTTLSATVDYAVYAPGQFGTSAAMGAPGHTPFDPSGGTGYVYAYEIFNTGGNAKVLTLSVALDYLAGAVPSSPTSIGHDPGTPAGGTAPTGTQAAIFNPASPPFQNARWSWVSSGGLANGGNSDILIFTSPYGPKMYASTMTGSGATQTGPGPLLPSPIPEPTTAALALIGAGFCAVAVKRIRRGHRVR